MPWTVSVTKNIIPQVRLAIEDRTHDNVRDHAHHVQEYASTTAPKRTGALRASFYVNGPEGESDYGIHAAEARVLNPTAHIVPELQAAVVDPTANRLRDAVTGRFTRPEAIVGSAVEYSLYVEEGTVHMAPRPTLRNAALQTERLFVDAMSKVADGF
jgi:hypothetical protein